MELRTGLLAASRGALRVTPDVACTTLKLKVSSTSATDVVEGVRVAVGVSVWLGVGEAVSELVVDGVVVDEGVCDGVAEMLAPTLVEGVSDAVEVDEAAAPGDSELVGVAEGVVEGLCVGVALSDDVDVADGVRDGEAVGLGDTFAQIVFALAEQLLVEKKPIVQMRQPLQGANPVALHAPAAQGIELQPAAASVPGFDTEPP